MSRPLFLLLSFRQETFIVEAVRAALNQAGQDLDILISDDCSDDSTWSLIKTATRDYVGPHNVTLNRNDRNLGLTSHLNKCLSETDATHVIVAAGDDVSAPDRSARVLERFNQTGAALVHSGVTPIDASGAPSNSQPTGKFQKTTALGSAARSLGLYVGATGAWDRSLLFDKYGPLPIGVYEDLIFGFRAALENRISFIDAPLVRYRVDVGSSKQSDEPMGHNDWVRDRREWLQRGIMTFQQRIADANTFGLAPNDQVVRLLKRKLKEFRARLDVLDHPARELVLDRRLRSLRHVQAWWSERKHEHRCS